MSRDDYPPELVTHQACVVPRELEYKSTGQPDPFCGITMNELVGRALRNASRHRPRTPQQLWVWVLDTFAVGSTVACNICIHFGRDPFEELKP
jgi:hypothetical protein